MSLKCYQFYLKPAATAMTDEEKKTAIENKLHALRLDVLRFAIDFDAPDEKSISFLSETPLNQRLLNDFFKAEQLAVVNLVETPYTQQPPAEKHHCANGCHDHDHPHPHQHPQNSTHVFKAIMGLAFGFGMMTLSFLSLTLSPGIILTTTLLSNLLSLYLGKTLYQSAWKALLHGRIEMSSLYSLSTLTLIVTSLTSLFVPGFNTMLESAPLILGFWHLGEAIEHHLIEKLAPKEDIRKYTPSEANLISGERLSVHHLLPNDVILLKEGDVIPADGKLKNDALIDTAAFNGKTEPGIFKSGDTVKQGMRIASGEAIALTITSAYETSYLSLIEKEMRQNIGKQTKTAQLTQQILKYFVPALLSIALSSGFIIGLFFSPALAIDTVLAVLVSACPCALSLITPMAFKIAHQKALSYGIRFEDGTKLETTASIDTLVFDLNGTLTQGRLSVKSLKVDDTETLNRLAALENLSEHPYAKTIVDYLAKHAQTPPDNPIIFDSIDTTHHSGIKGEIEGHTFMVGNQSLLSANGIDHPNPPYDDPAQGSVYVVQDGKVVGQIALHDPLRDEAIETIDRLKKIGLEVHLCTGADENTARNQGHLLGIKQENLCFDAAGYSSTDENTKSNYIQKLQQQGRKVAMIGDGINDLLAFKQADISIAIQSGIDNHALSLPAGICIGHTSLLNIPKALEIAQKTKTNIFQNLLISLGYNSTITLIASGALLTMGIALNPVLGVALMVVESSIVFLNLNRLNQQLNEASPPLHPSKASTQKSSSATLLEALEPSTLQITPQDHPQQTSSHGLRFFMPHPAHVDEKGLCEHNLATSPCL